MADRWNLAGGTPDNAWQADARHMIIDIPSLIEIGIFDPDLQPRSLVPAIHRTLTGDVAAKLNIAHQALESITTQKPLLKLLPQKDGYKFFVVMPLQPEGYLIAVFDGQSLLDSLTTQLARRYYNTIFYTGDGQTEGPFVVHNVNLKYGNFFPLLITPTPEFYEARASKVPFLLFLTGSLLGLMIAALVQFSKDNLAQSRQLERQSRSVMESETLLRLAMQYAPIGIALVAPSGKWLSANPALCQMLGYRETELLTLDYQTLTHPEDLDADVAQAGSLLARQASSYTMPKRYYHKDGQVIWELLSVAIMWNTDDTPRSFIAQIVDINQIKQTEMERDELIGKLVNTNAELERFAFAASHDLQEPLRMICNFTGLLQQDYGSKLDATAQEYINIATSSANRMRLLIRDLLDYARADFNDMPPELFDSAETVTHVRENLAAQIAGSNARIEIGPLPQLSGHPMRFASLMQNLINNALKYMPNNHQPVVEVQAERQDDMWLFSVRDNGIGMKADYIDQIFEPFKRLHSQQQYPGTGIGLAICRKIVSSMGGRIWVDSQLGSGSTFYFTVPALA